MNYAFKPSVKNKIMNYILFLTAKWWFEQLSLDKKKLVLDVSEVDLEKVLGPTVEPIYYFNLWLGIQSKFLNDKGKFPWETVVCILPFIVECLIIYD